MPEPTSPSLAIPGIEDLEPVGRGGFGTVYRGWQPDLRRKVAVKVLDAPASDEESAARFRREGMAMGALSDHPNVVPVYATGTVGDRLYFLMPLLADGSLADLLAAGPLDAATVAGLGRDLADALAAAHASGVLHRDVKPANVLRTAYGTFQLADFGVARFVDTTQTMGSPMHATVGYAAPEVLNGQSATASSDVYSLGATLHAALRGQPPFEGNPDEAPIALAVRVLTTEPPPLPPGVPAGLVEVVERAMAREPADRYASAEALRDAFDALDLAAPSTPVITPDTGPPTLVVPVPVTDRDPEPERAAEVPAPVADAPVTVASPAHEDEPVYEDEPLYEDEVLEAGARRPSRRPLALGLLALLVLLATGAWLLAGRDDDGPQQLSGDASSSTTAVPTTPTSPTTTAAPEVTSPPATLAEPSTTSVPAAGSSSAAQALRDYYALMDAGRIDDGWALLSPAYRSRTGEDSYRGFWSTISAVEVQDVAEDGLEAAATLRYTSDDGSTSTERALLRFIEEAGTGRLLIDDYRTA